MTMALLTSQQPAEALALGAGWARDGEDVVVVLLDAATIVLRPGHDDAANLRDATDAGVRVWAHDVAAAERLIDPGNAAIDLVDLEAVAHLVGEPETRAQWW
jgi:hypothetical protein